MGTVANMDFYLRTFELSFTSPGQDLDQGGPVDFQVFFSSNLSFLNTNDMLHGTVDTTVLKARHLSCPNCTMPSPLPPNERMVLVLGMNRGFVMEEQFFFRLQAVDEGGKFSLSNIARIVLTKKEEQGNSGTYASLPCSIFLLLSLA